MTEVINRISSVYVELVLAGLFAITGIYLTLRLFLPQIRYFAYAIRLALGLAEKEEDEILHIIKDKDIDKTRKGDISHFDSLSIALSASLGVGSIIGVMFAIISGGPGALFWMWMTGLLGMAIKYTEAVLSVKYRVETESGYAGGPMYYMQKGLKSKKLGIFYAILMLFTTVILGNLIQVNTAALIFKENNLNVPWETVFIALGLLAAFIVLSDLKRIAYFSRFFTPFMLFIYLCLGIYILFYNHSYLPKIFQNIIDHAFHPAPAFMGMTSGAFLLAVKSGISLGVFSSEAGLGSASISAASAKTDYTVKQGLVSMLVPFFDTLFVCTITGISIMVAVEKYDIFSSLKLNSENAAFVDPVILMSVFFEFFPTTVKSYNLFFFTLILFIFALSTIVGWYFYADRILTFLKIKKKNLFKTTYLLLIIPAAFIPYRLLWNTAGLLVSIVAIINLTAILFLSKQVFKETKIFFQKYPHKHDLTVRIYLYFLGILPKNTLSKIFGFAAGLHLPRFMMIPILLAFARIYRINVNEAELEISDYRSLNKFFTRALKTGSRIVEPDAASIVSPVDGRIIHFGTIEKGKLMQTKGISMSLEELLGSNRYLDRFLGGKYATIYLSPQDYHRIHSPCSGKITGYYYKPGKLYPVNLLAVNSIDGLFSKNERLITYIQTEFGLIALIKVGATSVGRIKVTYDENIATNRWKRHPKEEFYEKGIEIKKGEEIGRFEMGSTVIMIIEKEISEFLEIEEKQKLLFGQPFALFQPGKIESVSADNITKTKRETT
ncbi:MAG: archaetidylserine decarboxylase [Spirochaetia bacterium]|nr:archaetidylserine decarboxylase [Spirochaetia bacterium]